MAKVKLELQKKSFPEKIEFARQIVGAMTGNANFPAPSPTLAEVTAKSDELETDYNDALQKRQEAQAATTKMYNTSEELDKLLTNLSMYVESTSNGDVGIIQTSGMDVRDDSAPSIPVGVIQNLAASTGDADGEIDLSWDPESNARSYVVQMSIENPDNWTQAKVVTNSKTTVNNLTSGQKYWFRVAGVGSEGQGGWSNPAFKYAP